VRQGEALVRANAQQSADGSGTCALSNDALAPGFSLAGAVTLSGPDYMGSFSNLVPFAIEMAG